MNDCVGFSFTRREDSKFKYCYLYPLVGKRCPDKFSLDQNGIIATSWKDLKAGYQRPQYKSICYGKILGIIDVSLSLQF